MNMRPGSAVSAVQAGLQTADGGDTGIWRTPFSEMEPHRGGVELAHVLNEAVSAVHAGNSINKPIQKISNQKQYYYIKEVSSWKE